MLSTYQEVREYLESFIHAKAYERIEVGADNKLDPLARMRHFLALLGNPQTSFPAVVVSGTSGKGSTTYLLARMLAAGGYTVGFMSSPHLQKINERMQLAKGGDFMPISDGALAELLNGMQSAIEAMHSTRFGPPTYYEILAGATLRYFSQQQLDIAVIEVGLEGKLEATNLVDPLVFILTNISLDHTAILGDTVLKIAEEATYRIRGLLPSRGRIPSVVTGITQPSIIRLTERRAGESGAELARLGENFTVTQVRPHSTGVTFNFQSDTIALKDVHVSLLGMYQATNAALAIQAVLRLRNAGFEVSQQAIYTALSTAHLNGRFELRESQGVRCVIDGAHNPAKMRAFCSSLHRLYKHEKKVFLIAFKKDKDVRSLLRMIDKEAYAMVMSRFTSSIDLGKNLGMDMSAMAEQVAAMQLQADTVILEENSMRALAQALELARAEHALLVVTGSMYFIGEVSNLLDQNGGR